jgi:hypothetical protein
MSFKNSQTRYLVGNDFGQKLRSFGRRQGCGACQGTNVLANLPHTWVKGKLTVFTTFGAGGGGAGALEVRPIVKLPCAELDVFRGGSTGSAGRLVSRCLGGFAIDANRASESATEASTTKGGEKWLLIAVLPMCPFLLTSNFSIFHQRPNPWIS